MIIVGELINSSRKMIEKAIADRDLETIQKTAIRQYEKGARYIDVNAGIFMDREVECIKWMVSGIQEVVDVPCCIDSLNPKAVEAGLSVHTGTAMINSISLEKERYDGFLSLVAGTKLKIIALCVSDEGIPETANDKVRIAEKLVNSLVKKNISINNIFMDPLVQPISVDSRYGFQFLESIERLTALFKGIHFMCGLSNISHGLPERGLINRTFLGMAIAKGLDGAILNPLDDPLMAVVTTAKTLKGNDAYCTNYLMAYREKRLNH